MLFSTAHPAGRLVAAAAVGSAFMLALAGCSSPSEGTSPTEVTIWHYWDGTNADTFDAMVAEYNDAHPDVKISASNVPNADFLTKLRASATSRTLPDIAIGDLIWVPQIEQMGGLADLSKTLPSSTLADINPALTSFGNIGGAQVSVPVSANNLAYMYNKTLFTEAGLDPENPPTTWDDLISTGRTILEKTGKPGYDLFTQAGDSGEGLTWNFQVNLWQAGGEFLNDDNSAAAFNTPEGAEAVQFWVDLIDSGVSPYAKWGEFEKGQGGSAQEGSWMVGIWAADPPFEFGVAKAPYPTDGHAATNLGGEQAMIFDNSDKETAAASDFLAWFLEPDQVTAWSEKTGMLPVLSSVATGTDYLDWVDSTEPRLRPFVEQMADAHARPNTPLYPQISLAFATEIEKALAGETSVSEALDKAEAAVNAVIDKG
ncbi:sn-glycerol-3-phosphate-binding periplasmic protein UgpB precursor [Microbacterium hydrocarbonoxydans]|uniref:sn-glycerol-3-phosphate-binding periplasmic protein UgpB n=1 Tax=Microbacterium hydrocarbonoxydans TaxID=273678 RepID=A0A0M2HRE7_9MICO|nr:ABC transporter substrate-binding protein [Microbacterium hydrocarbonoxydans]KJL47056.1 sn-glycerol-3-phosphate-binding periplasmic protein UgpB precursor [Microbacterium hydrocarbonoxydans]